MEAVRLYSRPFTADVRSALKLGTLVVCWQVQSKLAALVLLVLVAVSPWWALPVMLAWSIAATCAYVFARERGVPDILALSDPDCSRVRSTGLSLGQVWLVGLNAFAFARIARPFLERESLTVSRRVGRAVVLLLGLTLFGVAISQHMLFHAGFRSRHLLMCGIFGSFLNVPFRVLCGAVTMQLALRAFNLEQSLPPYV